MNDEPLDDEIRAALRTVARAPDALADGQHLEPEEIAAWRGGELAPEREEIVRAHLVACAECSDLLLDFDALATGVLGADLPAPSEFEVAALWRALRAPERTSPLDRVEAAPSVRRPRGRAAQLLAAALAAVTLGLALHNAALRRELEELRAPEASPPLLELLATPERGEPEAVPLLRWPRGARSVVVILDPPSDLACDPCAVEVAEAGGRALWRSARLGRSALGTFTLALPRAALGRSRAIEIRLGPTAGPFTAPGAAAVIYSFRIDESPEPSP